MHKNYKFIRNTICFIIRYKEGQLLGSGIAYDLNPN